MDDERDRLTHLIESVADGSAIDWDAVARNLGDDALRDILRHLRTVAEVAAVHRSQVADEEPVTAGVGRAGPASDPGILSTTDEGVGRWGHFVLVEKLGEGAFGDVFHARDTWLDHAVALKLLKPHLADHSRLLDEARRLVRIRHPNVVTVHGADLHEGRVGFWMELIRGQTLSQVVAKEGLRSAAEAALIGQDLCRAMAAVHAAGIVHRDIKAQNVMRQSGGRLVLMDFGAGQPVPKPGVPARTLAGTPLYLAPELFDEVPATFQSDIYALGVLLFFLVSTRFPVEGGSVSEIVAAHSSGRRLHLGDLRPDLPDDFVGVVEQMIARDPGRRFGTATETRRALEGVVAPVDPSAEHVRGDKRHAVTGDDSRWHLSLGKLAGAAITIVTLATVLGFIACRFFEQILQIDRDFVAGPGMYFDVGIQALFPFFVYWMIPGAVITVIVLVRLLVGARVASHWTSRKLPAWSPPPVAMAAAVFLVSVAGLAVLTRTYFLNLFGTLLALQDASGNTLPDVSILTPAFHDVHRAYGNNSAYLSFLVALAAWRWFPRLERQAGRGDATIRSLRWATLAIAFLIVVGPTLPRRFIWEPFELVVFENRRSVVIGTNGEELLLYATEAGQQIRRRVKRDAPELVRTGRARTVFDQADN